jgi:hypothetical protein
MSPVRSVAPGLLQVRAPQDRRARLVFKTNVDYYCIHLGETGPSKEEVGKSLGAGDELTSRRGRRARPFLSKLTPLLQKQTE